jgi:hypothetical protein
MRKGEVGRVKWEVGREKGTSLVILNAVKNL